MTGGSFHRADHFANASNEFRYRQFRVLRTQMVLDLGWRTEADLVDGVDADHYDAPETDTRSLILWSHAGIQAACRLTRCADGPGDAMSFDMWGDNREVSRLRHSFESRVGVDRAIDATRLFFNGFRSARLVVPIVGAGSTLVGRDRGMLATTNVLFAKVLRKAGIGFEVLHEARLGSHTCLLMWVHPASCNPVTNRETRRSLTWGAWALCPELAQLMPFFEPATVEHGLIDLTTRRDVVPAKLVSVG